MREIKFRAWAIKAKTMHPSWTSTFDGDGKYILMQYTGLKDKSGEEIYEGDILKFQVMGYSQVGKVEWNGNGYWMTDENGQRNWPNKEYAEVIGNIYESPELLKK